MITIEDAQAFVKDYFAAQGVEWEQYSISHRGDCVEIEFYLHGDGNRYCFTVWIEDDGVMMGEW